MKWAKQAAKHFLNSILGCKCPRRSVIERADKYISFDIFDTLIIRDVSEPREVFRWIEQNQQLSGFFEKRVKAEKAAREKAKGEVTIQDIYSSFPGITSEQVPEYCQMELDAELQLCHPNPRLIPFYEECVQRKKVVLISDMYFPSEMMTEILKKCEIFGYEKLFISCEMGETKRSGNLYKAVLQELGISEKKLIHIGNDFVTDYVKAKRNGAKAVKVRTIVDK